MANIFITGAAGFVGRELQAQCRSRGIGVSAVDMSPASQTSKHIQADIRTKDITSLIPEGTDAIIHLAGLTRDGDCKDKAYACFDANIMATLNLMEAAKARHVKQFIFASSEWVYGECKDNTLKTEDSQIDAAALKSEYAFSKFVSEVNLRQKSLHGFCDVTILRFGIIYGSRAQNWAAVESIFNTVRTKDEVKIGALKTGRCFIHVSDIAAGIIAAIGLSGFNVLNLEGDKLVTLGDIVDVSIKILNKTPVVVETDPGNVNIRNIANAKAKMVLKWEPKISLREGLEQLNAFLTKEEFVRL